MERLDSEVKTTYPSDMYSSPRVKGNRRYLGAEITLTLYVQATDYITRHLIYRLHSRVLPITGGHRNAVEDEL